MLFLFYALPRIQQQLCVRSLIRRYSNHNYSVHAQCIFTQYLLTTFWCRYLPWLTFSIVEQTVWLILLPENYCLGEISINVNLLFPSLLYMYCVYICLCSIVVACLIVYLFIRFFIQMLLPYFYLFVLFLQLLFMFLTTPFSFS